MIVVKKRKISKITQSILTVTHKSLSGVTLVAKIMTARFYCSCRDKNDDIVSFKANIFSNNKQLNIKHYFCESKANSKICNLIYKIMIKNIQNIIDNYICIATQTHSSARQVTHLSSAYTAHQYVQKSPVIHLLCYKLRVLQRLEGNFFSYYNKKKM